MRKLFFVLAFVLVAICGAKAQNASIVASDTSIYWMYAELVGTQKFLSTKVAVEIDFGQGKKWFSRGSIITDAEGQMKSFNSMVDAMNFMGQSDWEFVQAYIVSVGNQNVYHWLLKRACRKDEKGEFLPITRADWKARQSKN